MRIAIVSVGDELLSGDTVDTNSAWLGQTFSGVGFTVLRVIVVPDDVVAISDAIRTATAGADAVLVQGGLGPTSDDLSREGIAAASGVPLHRDADIEKRLRAWYGAQPRCPRHIAAHGRRPRWRRGAAEPAQARHPGCALS